MTVFTVNATEFGWEEVAAVRPQFLAARAGDWLGPLKIIEGFPLFAIIKPARSRPPTAISLKPASSSSQTSC